MLVSRSPSIIKENGWGLLLSSEGGGRGFNSRLYEYTQSFLVNCVHRKGTYTGVSPWRAATISVDTVPRCHLNYSAMTPSAAAAAAAFESSGWNTLAAGTRQANRPFCSFNGRRTTTQEFSPPFRRTRRLIDSLTCPELLPLQRCKVPILPVALNVYLTILL